MEKRTGSIYPEPVSKTPFYGNFICMLLHVLESYPTYEYPVLEYGCSTDSFGSGENVLSEQVTPGSYNNDSYNNSNNNTYNISNMQQVNNTHSLIQNWK